MTLQKVLGQMGHEIQEMVQRSEVLGEQGDVDGAQAAATQAEAIKVRDRWTILQEATAMIVLISSCGSSEYACRQGAPHLRKRPLRLPKPM